MSIVVKPIDLHIRHERNLFAHLTARLYKGQKSFAPPLQMDERPILDPNRNPYLQENPYQCFIAWRGDEPVGRISAQLIHAHDHKYGSGTGFFGHADWIDEAAVAHALLDEAQAWLKQRGCRTMQGPYSFTINHVCGVQSDGFGNLSYIKTGYHPPHIINHLKQAGLYTVRRLVCAVHDTATGDFDARYKAIESKWQNRDRLKLEHLNRRTLPKARDVMADIYNDAYLNNWNSIPTNDAEAKFIYDLMGPIVYDGWAVIAHWDNKPAGMIVQIPNLDEAPRFDNGMVGPSLIYKLLGKKWQSTRVPIICVRRELHDTRAGAMVASALMADMVATARKAGVRAVEISWMLDDNYHVLNLVCGLPAMTNKSFSILEKEI